MNVRKIRFVAAGVAACVGLVWAGLAVAADSGAEKAPSPESHAVSTSNVVIAGDRPVTCDGKVLNISDEQLQAISTQMDQQRGDGNHFVPSGSAAVTCADGTTPAGVSQGVQAVAQIGDVDNGQ